MPPPAGFRDAVVSEIRQISPFPPATIGDGDDLRVKLGLTDDLKRSLASPFQRIARRFKDDASVTMDDCTELEKVKDAVDLVASKSGFEQ